MAKETIHWLYFLVHREGNGNCGKLLYFDSDLQYETQDDTAVDSADPPFLWSVRPRIQTSCLMAPQGTGVSVKLIPWEGSLPASLYYPRFLLTSCQSYLSTIQLQ